MLRAASKFTSDKYVLKQIYYSRIRCKLEQSAAFWSSSLTKKNTHVVRSIFNSNEFVQAWDQKNNLPVFLTHFLDINPKKTQQK